MAKYMQHHVLKDMVNEGIKSLQKWNSCVNGSLSPAYFICLILDPTVKDLYFQCQWSSKQYATSMAQLKEVQDSVDGSPQDELQKYLQSAIETTTDIPGTSFFSNHQHKCWQEL
ncbi:hypothetical protein V8E53_006417 [Lactarius tabidus]